MKRKEGMEYNCTRLGNMEKCEIANLVTKKGLNWGGTIGPKKSSAISSTEQRGRTQWPMTRNLISETGPSQHHPLGYLHTQLPHIHGQKSSPIFNHNIYLFIYLLYTTFINNKR